MIERQTKFFCVLKCPRADAIYFYTKVTPGNANLGGRLSTFDLLIKVSYFEIKENNILIIKMCKYKLVGTRRSTVLSLPLQLDFLGYLFCYFLVAPKTLLSLSNIWEEGLECSTVK